MPFRITVLGFGSQRELAGGELERYAKLVSPWAQLTYDFKKPWADRSASLADQLSREEKDLLLRVPPRSRTAALSEDGRLMDSRTFAAWVQRRVESGSDLALLVGSAQGLSEQLKKHCDETLSLSPLTFPYRLCLTVLVEQIYRAFTILHDHPYHK